MRSSISLRSGFRGGGGQGQSNANARDGGTEIVRGAHQHALIAFDQIANFARHDVKIPDQVGNLVTAGAAGETGARLQIALGNGVGSITQTDDGAGEVLSERRAEQRGKQRAKKNREQEAARQ